MPKKPAKKSQPKKAGPKKKTGPKGPRKQPTWTPKELAFVEAFKGNQSKAAKIAYPKSNNPSVLGSELMAKPHIREACEKKLAAMIDESGKRLARVVDIGRNEIIMLNADIARKGDSDSARVAALRELKDIFGLSAKNDRDTDMFAGWSEEELREFADTGFVPKSVAARVLSGHGAPPAQPDSAK
jgi:hypothetical protein